MIAVPAQTAQGPTSTCGMPCTLSLLQLCSWSGLPVHTAVCRSAVSTTADDWATTAGDRGYE